MLAPWPDGQGRVLRGRGPQVLIHHSLREVVANLFTRARVRAEQSKQKQPPAIQTRTGSKTHQLGSQRCEYIEDHCH